MPSLTGSLEKGKAPGDCCPETRCWEYMSDTRNASYPGLTCTECLAEGAACGHAAVSATPCCRGFLCGASNVCVASLGCLQPGTPCPNGPSCCSGFCSEGIYCD